MDAVRHKRDSCDLSYSRRRRILVGVSPDRAARQEDLNERRKQLNSISKDLCEVLLGCHVLISCISFATHLLHPAAESIEPPELAKRPLPAGRPDKDSEEVVISARLATVHDDFATRILVESLKRVNQVILQINVDSPIMSQELTISIESLTQVHTLSTMQI